MVNFTYPQGFSIVPSHSFLDERKTFQKYSTYTD